MPIRSQPLSPAEMIAELYRRMKSVEDVTRRRCLPAGYEFKVESGALTIVRTADGATQTMSI